MDGKKIIIVVALNGALIAGGVAGEERKHVEPRQHQETPTLTTETWVSTATITHVNPFADFDQFT